jgi:PAS domain S-box-containing protein
VRIAVVEDDADLREITTVVLRRAGYDVVSAADGDSGLVLLRESRPDLVLLDLMLPGRDGFEILDDLGREGRIDDLSIAIVSALVGAADRRRGLELGAVAFVPKPFTNDELLDVVQDLLACDPGELQRRRQQALRALDGDDPHAPPHAEPPQAPITGVLDLSVDAIVSVDTDQRIVGFNRGAEAMFGYSSEEIVGAPLERLIPAGLADAHREHVRSFGRSVESSRHMGERGEIHGRRRDGTLFPAEASISKQVVDGRLTFTAVLRDVSERRQLIDELRARARQQAAIADLGQRALTATGRDGFVREVAEVVHATLDVDLVRVAQLVTGSDVLHIAASAGRERTPPPQPPVRDSHLGYVIGARSPVIVPDVTGETRFDPTSMPGADAVASAVGVPVLGPHRAFGALGAYSSRPRPFSEDDIHFLQAAANVIAGFLERERVEDRLRRFLDAAPDATLVVSSEGRVVSANPQAETLLGHARDRLIGRTVEDLVPERYRTTHAAHREEYASAPRLRPMGAGRELSVLRADGTEVPVDIMLSPLETEEGVLVVAALRDVSERRRMEAMRDAFLRAVSHDLRTPLAALIGYAGIVAGDDDIQGDSRQYVDRILSNGRKLERLLGDLLDLDRLTRGVLEPNRRPTDLAALARQVVASLERRPASVEIVEDDGGVTASVDPAQVERILENLLVNAARHTPEGTPCRVLVRRVRSGVELVVEDEGPGVPDEVRTSIFEPFQRGDHGHHSPGTGIGLALVARFAELHGGEALVEDRPGGGARFVVRLADG